MADKIAGEVTAKNPIREGERSKRVELLQRLLLTTGAQLVPDGEFGPVTLEAVKRFQATVKISPSGLFGPSTAKALDKWATGTLSPIPADQPSVLAVAPWLATMRAITGTKEIPGWQSNPLILRWRDFIIAQYPDIAPNLKWYKSDATPWCGLTEGYCLAVNRIKPPLAPLGAANYLPNAWPGAERITEPRQGAIMIFSRVGGHHVTTLESWTGSGRSAVYRCRGGNQSDMVNITNISGEHLQGMVWPKGY